MSGWRMAVRHPFWRHMEVLDLFSGIGGFSLGLERTGSFRTAAFCERDTQCQKVLKKHWPNVRIFTDVKRLSSLELDTKIDVICGGFPCQDISFAGARKGIIHGSRSSLWKEFHRIIAEVRPSYAIIENVEYLRKNGLGVVLNDLARIGYDAEWTNITANSVGYPHKRGRLFIVSYPSGKRFHTCPEQIGYIHVDKRGEDTEVYGKREECITKLIKVCPVLSRRSFEEFVNTLPNRKSAVSKLRRVTDGVPKGLDESLRRDRIQQLGNSIIPDIAEWIGRIILKFEGLEVKGATT